MKLETLIASAVFAACAVPLSLWIGFGTKRRHADDAAAGVDFNPAPADAAPPRERPEHSFTVCAWCNTVLSARIAEGGPILSGDGLKVSHGICQTCLPRFEKPVPAAHHGGGLAAGTQPANPRPALAGAGTL